MIHCYDYLTSSFLLFKSTKDASVELNIRLRAVQKSIQLNYLVKKRFLFDTEEISNLNIEEKKPKPYYLFNSFTNEVIKLNNVKEVIEYIYTSDSITTTCDVVCHNIKRKQRIARKYYCSRDYNFSFIKTMRKLKKNLKHQKECIKKKSGSTSLSYEDIKENRDAALKAVQENKSFRFVTTKEAVRNSLKREFKSKNI